MLVEREAMQERRKKRERKKHTLITKASVDPTPDIASQLLPRSGTHDKRPGRTWEELPR